MKNGMYQKRWIKIFGLLIILSVSMLAQGNEDGYALLIQASPPDGGLVAPGMGIHKIQIGQTVALSATPKPGYRFLYWLGDVSSTSGVDTTVSVDSPKMVVAVFTRDNFDENLPGAGILDGQNFPGGRGGVDPLGSPGSASPASGGSPSGFRFPDIPDEPNDNTDDIPVPGENDDIPVPGDNEVPEPATVVLLGLGSGFLLRRRKSM
jgi:hypothetical protein